MRSRLALVLAWFAVIVLGGCSLSLGAEEPFKLVTVTLQTRPEDRQGFLAEERTVNLPPGFSIKVFATGLKGVRWLDLAPDGTVYATVMGEGRVVTLVDGDGDGVAEDIKTFATDLPVVHGIAIRDGSVYVATEQEVVRLQDTVGDGIADTRETIIADLPVGGNHKTRTIIFDSQGRLYLSMGSECNACVDQDKRQAAISRYSADGTFEKVYAKGIRNAVGITFHPLTGDLWATNNGRDMLGDEVPPETIYNIKEDGDYGYPYCYGDRVPDETQGPPPGYCEKVDRPSVLMQAHSAPLGLTFYNGDRFPAQFKGDLFVAFHGSWNRSELTGYKLVRIRFKDNHPDRDTGENIVEDFATGWLKDGTAWGRPVNPLVTPRGSLLLTDDYANTIYSIDYAGGDESDRQ